MGRFIVHIRFPQLGRQLAANDELRQQYFAFMQEYLSLDHMIEVIPEETHSTRNYYLPHHAVCKVESTTKKLRVVVFNASHGKITERSFDNRIHFAEKWRKF